MNLLVATRNPHKFVEVEAILRLPGLRLVSLARLPNLLPSVAEDGATFEANAAKKARELALATGMWTLADDSGLEVAALGGAPGVHSARYAGRPGDDAANNRLLLQRLQGQTERRACFRCVIAMASPNGTTRTVEGRCPGRIVTAPRGTHGFGYDPLFEPEGFSQTFAELPPETKNQISHRARALRRAMELWAEILCGDPRDWPMGD